MWGSVEKTLYVIIDGEVEQKLVWDERVSQWIQAVAVDMNDMAMSILSRFEAWIDRVGLFLNLSEVEDGFCTPFTADITRDLEMGEEIRDSWNDDLSKKLWEKH